MSEDQENPKLRPVPKGDPDGEHTFWILDGEKLVVEVKNYGKDMTKEVKVKVDFRGFARRGGDPPKFTPEELELPKLGKGKKSEPPLKFDLPTEDALEADFRFIIIIDEKGKLENFTNVLIKKDDLSK